MLKSCYGCATANGSLGSVWSVRSAWNRAEDRDSVPCCYLFTCRYVAAGRQTQPGAEVRPSREQL